MCAQINKIAGKQTSGSYRKFCLHDGGGDRSESYDSEAQAKQKIIQSTPHLEG